MSTQIRPDEISAILIKELEKFQSTASTYEVGTVVKVGDGIARIHGLSKVMAGELVEFQGAHGLKGLVLNLESDNVGVAILGSANNVREGDTVIRTNQIPFIQSRASWQLTMTTLAIMLVGALLPFSPLAQYLGFVPLPWQFWPLLAVTLLCYVGLTQLIKQWMVKKNWI